MTVDIFESRRIDVRETIGPGTNDETIVLFV